MAELGKEDFLIQQRAKNVKVFEREGRDVHKDVVETARDLGKARLNHARLNLFTSLGPGDTEDNFKFNVTTEGRLRLGIWPEEGIRIQISDSRGKLIADSGGTGKYLEKFDDIKKSRDRVSAGDYYIKVTREDTSDTQTEIGYSLQVQVGDQYREDYDTIEYTADPATKDEPVDTGPQATPTAQARQSEMLATMVGDGLNNFNNLINRTIGIFTTLLGR